MKRFLLLTIFLISINVLKSQDTTFNRFYRLYNRVTNIMSLIPSDSAYFALFGDLDANNKQNYGIIKFNKLGDIIDSSIFSTSNKYYGTDKPLGHGFILTSDSCFLYCGGTKDTAGWVSGFLAKFDYNLDTIWTKIFYHPDTAASLQKPTTSVMHLTDVKETPDGNYILTGNYNSNADGYEDRSFLLKLDTSGNVIWQKLNPSNISLLYDIEIAIEDSGYYCPSMKNASMPKHVSLFKFDKFGNILWSIQTNHSQIPNYPHYPMDIEIINDSISIMVSGVVTTIKKSVKNSVIIASVNTNKKILRWEKQFEFAYSRRDITLEQSIGANLTIDGNIAISATIIHPDPDIYNRGTILLINQNGDSLWQRYYTHNWDDSSNVDLQLNDLIVCDDGGFLFGGFAIDFGDGKIKSWLVKTDSMGMTKAAFTLGIEEENTLIIRKQKPLLYPNPATDNFRLRFEQSPTVDYELSIYSVSGKLVKQHQLTAFGNEYRVGIGELKAGVYFVRLQSDGEVVFSSKFVKQ